MKTSKILITSLLAAAAMGTNAFADVNVTQNTTNTTTASQELGNISFSGDYTYTWKITAWGTATVSGISGTGTLSIERGQSGGNAQVLKLSGTNTDFTGTIAVKKYDTSSTRNVFLALQEEDAAANTTISVTDYGGLLLSGSSTTASNVKIAGLTGNSTGVVYATTIDGTTNQIGNGDAALTQNGTVARTLIFTGSDTYVYAGTIGSTTNQSSLNLTKSGTGTQTLSGTTYLGNLDVTGGELIFSGASATSKGTANIAGTLTTSGSGVVKVLENGVLDLSGATVSLANAIQNSGQVTLSTGTQFEVSTFGQTVSLISGTGTIFGAEWNTLTNKNFTYNGVMLGRSKVDVSSAGSVNISYVEGKTLTWNGSSSDTWSEAVVGTEPSSKPWKDESDADDAFYAGDSVVFSKDETTTVTVADSGVNANTVTISAGTVSFTGGTATALGGVSVTGGTLNLSTNVFAAGTAFNVSGGTLTLGSAFALTAGSSIDVSDAGTVSGTITSMAAGSSLTLEGTGISNVTLSANGNAISGNIIIGAGSTVTVAQDKAEVFNYYQSGINITLNGGVLDLGNKRQTIGGGTKITLNGGEIKATGVSKPEKDSSTEYYGSLDLMGTREINVTEDSVISADVRLRADLTVNVSSEKTLTISGVIDPYGDKSKTNIDAWKIGGKIIKTGKGTLVLSGDNVDCYYTNRSYDNDTELREGTIEVRHSDALGSGAVNVTGNATLEVGNGLSVGNAVTVAADKKLTLKATGSTLNGAISGDGSLKVETMYYGYLLGSDEVVTLAGGNTLAGTLEVEGVKLNVSALGTGTLKITDYSNTSFGSTLTARASVNATAANVVLHNVSLLANNSAQLTADTDCSFTVAEGATLYLDIGALTDTVLTGDSVALKIAGSNVISGSAFFDTVLVGTYDSGDNWIDDTEWAYKAGSWNASTGTLYLISVPEPSAFGLLAGAGALALVAARRRRTKKA